ncbi:MAG: response regulator transcription factor [Gammaproteobacteria bacterium]|nr:response regulator transcription factor [Gammaproteobacteria bacterium]
MKILLIDDHDLFRDGMHWVLAQLDNNLQIFDAGNYEEGKSCIDENPDLDLILLDLGLPEMTDIEIFKAIRADLPATPIVVLSGNDDRAKVQEMLNLGARGYIPKSTNAELLINSLRLILAGGFYIPREALPSQDTATEELVTDQSYLADAPLTPRQQDVLQRLVHGDSNKAISAKLNMSVSTVRVHIAAILKELDVSNRTQAVHAALQKGWTTVDLD